MTSAPSADSPPSDSPPSGSAATGRRVLLPPRRPGGGGSAQTPHRAGRTHRWWGTPWLFLVLGLTVTLLFVLFPFLNTVVLAFTDATMVRGGRFIGLGNFARLAEDHRFWTALLNSSLYVVCVVPVMVVLPLLLACLVSRPGRFVGMFRTAYYMPVVMSAVVVGLIWTNLLDSRGLVNELLSWLHLVSSPVPFVTDRWLLLFSAMFVTVWTGLGYYMVIYVAALANVSPVLYDAAAVDGAGPVRTFLSVTVPGVRGTMALVGVLSSVAAFRVFSEIYVLSGNTGGPGGEDLTMTMLIQREGTGLTARTGYAAAVSVVMFLITLGMLLVQLRLQRREGDAE
ncbi:carbohydrate ABC transporter permease [Streptomyces sp. FIT100]|uniref:carbohydrate ABC transporter permease n=1 Tax=Streptomyces sp. FIT100 TaxID=2837956 RepID=UPI0021C8D0DF|nr:sugar ABC transporter permease [Streptomyces sp. FIT100]UUN25193.1 sugar ABC transporter permease [Streptomyces sp. FIT100]